MKKTLASVLFFVALPNLSYADADCKTMVMTGHSNYPPLSWRDREDPSKMTGIAVDILENALKGTGVKVESRYVGPWKRAQLNVKTGEVDAIQNAYINEERKTYMEYTNPPYIGDPTVLFVKKGATFPFEKKEDLIGKMGASPIGESYGDDWDNFAKAKLQIDYTVSVEQAFKKMLAGRNQYVVFGYYPGVVAAEEAGLRDQIEILPKSVITEGMYIAISKKSACLKYKDLISKKIAEMVADGTPQKLVEKYTKIWDKQKKLPLPAE